MQSRRLPAAWRFAALLASVLILSALLLAACGDDEDDGDTAPTEPPTGQQEDSEPPSDEPPEGDDGAMGATISVTMRDFEIVLDAASVPAFAATFAISNEGPSEHDFVVLRTDLAPDALPMNEAGTQVDVDAEGVEEVDAAEGLAVGGATTLELGNLEPGRYVVICNIEGHYELGMHTPLTVE